MVKMKGRNNNISKSLLLLVLVTILSLSFFHSTDNNILFVNAVDTTNSDDTDDDKNTNIIINSLIEWIISNGGTYNKDLLEYHIDDSSKDETKNFYLYAKKNIQNNEILFEIPTSCIYNSDDATSNSNNNGNKNFRINERIVADWNREGTYYPGYITNINYGRKTCEIQYDDGDYENNVPFKLIRKNSGDNKEDMCSIVKKLYDEESKSPSSISNPYVKYLLGRGKKNKLNIPLSWSKPGKYLFNEIVSGSKANTTIEYEKYINEYPVGILPPFNIDINFSYKNECLSDDSDDEKISDEENEKLTTLLLIIKQYGYDTTNTLIPLLDMLKHRNGPMITNTIIETTIDVDESDESSEDESDKIKVKSTRAIYKGEPLYISRNFCLDCLTSTDSKYGTPELLRDYGIVEDLPQRWFMPIKRYDNELLFDVFRGFNDQIEVNWLPTTSENYIDEPNTAQLNIFENEIKRLRKMIDDGKFDYESGNTAHPDIPKKELYLMKKYVSSLIIAMTSAIIDTMDDVYDNCLPNPKLLDEGLDVDEKTGMPGTCNKDELMSRYDTLIDEYDTLNYQSYTCKFGQEMRFTKHETIEDIKSHYQHAVVWKEPNNQDTCFQLDGIVQICGSYRPHYHEMMVHYTSRFLPQDNDGANNNKLRVVFVGGGDSMLLHEIIKYPNLELVIGLELDQTITRKSFKHFGTQPHWDKHDKVQWWFGDASKSLLMLPKSYFGSFDMVLVDLSETVMSKTVTKGLDIMGALALLLKHDGIFVKNELYLKQLSDIFKYTVQMHFFDIPVVCSQGFILGTNSPTIDFLLREQKDQPLLSDNLMYAPYAIENTTDPYDQWHDYKRNYTRSHIHCREPDSDVDTLEVIGDTQDASPGILMILDVENIPNSIITKLSSISKLSTLLQTTLTNKGSLNVLSTVTSSSDDDNDDDTKPKIVTIICKEGYVTARLYTKSNHCSFDIQLWSSFDEHEPIKEALIAALTSNDNGDEDVVVSSAYRIVAGGMFGIDKWKDDKKTYGPKFTQTCDGPDDILSLEPASVLDTSDSTFKDDIHMILEEVTKSFIHDNTNTNKDEGDDIYPTLVICGRETDYCPSTNLLHNDKEEFHALTTIFTSEDIIDDKDDDGTRKSDFEMKSAMIAYEKVVLEELMDVKKKHRAIIFDASIPKTMGQIILKIFTSIGNRKRMLTDDVLVVFPMLDKNDVWKRLLLDRFRHDILTYDPLYRAEVVMKTSRDSMELGIVSSGDLLFTQHLKDMKSNIEKRTVAKDLDIDIRNINGGMWKFMPDFEPTEFFVPTRYDQTLPLEQWKSQVPVSHQSVTQLETAQDNSMSNEQIKNALEKALTLTKNVGDDNDEVTVVHQFTDNIGDGCILVAVWSTGGVTALWDGRIHVDVNLYTDIKIGESVHNQFVNNFKNQFSNKLDVVLRDIQPRGYGRVVNFLEDIEPRSDPHWIK